MTQPAAASTAQDGTRVYAVPVDGVTHMLPSVSTVKYVLDAPGINGFKLKTVAREVAADPVLQRMALDGQEWKAQKEALARDTRKADLGTAVHDWSEAVELGESGVDEDGPADWHDPDFKLPRGWDDLHTFVAEVRPYVVQYLTALAAFGVKTVESECTTYNTQWQYAGTFDRVQRFPETLIRQAFDQFGGVPESYDGVLVVTDLKAGEKVWPETALQLAAYANAEGIYDAQTQQRRPMLNVRKDIGFVWHVRPTFCHLVPYDLTNAWGAWRSISRAWQWQNRQAQAAVGKPIPAPVSTPDPEELV